MAEDIVVTGSSTYLFPWWAMLLVLLVVAVGVTAFLVRRRKL